MGAVATFLALVVSAPIAGVLLTVLGGAITAVAAMYKTRKVDVPTSRATQALQTAQASQAEANAATQMLQAQQTFIDGVTKQLAEAQRQAADAQSSANAAKLAAESAKQQLAESETRAAEREHKLVNEKLQSDARVAVLERKVDSQHQEIEGLRARLGQFERRKS